MDELGLGFWKRISIKRYPNDELGFVTQEVFSMDYV